MSLVSVFFMLCIGGGRRTKALNGAPMSLGGLYAEQTRSNCDSDCVTVPASDIGRVVHKLIALSDIRRTSTRISGSLNGTGRGCIEMLGQISELLDDLPRRHGLSCGQERRETIVGTYNHVPIIREHYGFVRCFKLPTTCPLSRQLWRSGVLAVKMHMMPTWLAFVPALGCFRVLHTALSCGAQRYVKALCR